MCGFFCAIIGTYFANQSSLKIELESMSTTLDTFGRFIVENLRDKQIDNFKGLMEGRWRAKSIQNLQNNLSRFDNAEKAIIKELVEDILTKTMHDLLFAIHEESDLETGLKVLVDGENIAEVSEGLHMEIYDEEGWIQKFSRHKVIEQ